ARSEALRGALLVVGFGIVVRGFRVLRARLSHKVQRIIVSGDQELAIFVKRSREYSDDVDDFNISKDALLSFDFVRVETHLKPRAEALELFVDPSPRGADSSRRMIGFGEDVSGLETLELLFDGGDSLFGDSVNNALDRRVDRCG